MDDRVFRLECSVLGWALAAPGVRRVSCDLAPDKPASHGSRWSSDRRSDRRTYGRLRDFAISVFHKVSIYESVSPVSGKRYPRLVLRSPWLARRSFDAQLGEAFKGANDHLLRGASSFHGDEVCRLQFGHWLVGTVEHR